MSRRQQDTAFPLQPPRLDLGHPTQNDDYERAKDKARELLKSILPASIWTELEDKGTIQITRKRGTYIISLYSQTEIRDLATGRCVAYACLQLSVAAPTYDRMVAEYLLIKNAEDVYWKTANIFYQNVTITQLGLFLLTAFDMALFINLLLQF